MKKIFNRVYIIIQYCFLQNKISDVRKKHKELSRVLKEFKQAGLIRYNTYFIYLFSYLSRSMNGDTKLTSLVHHYKFLKNNLSISQLSQLFNKGIVCYKERNEEDEFKITLTFSNILEIEGSLSLFLEVNNIRIANLSFSILPGHIFGLADQNIIYISCLQRFGKQAKMINKAKKHFKDIIPSVILFKALEAVASSFNIQKFIGVTAINQLSFKNAADYERYYNVYDEFWQQNGGELLNGNYIMSCPVPQKDILLIKQTHRNRVRKKRQKLQEIHSGSYISMTNFLSNPGTMSVDSGLKARPLVKIGDTKLSLQNI